jgi:hypothetical protein
MGELIHDKVIKEILQELIGDAGNKQPFGESLVNRYVQDLAAQAQLLVKSGSKVEDLQEYYLQELRGNIMDSVVKALLKSYEYKDRLYKKSYDRLKAAYKESESWGDLFTEIYEDEQYLNEIFVRLVEEEEGVAITSAKQLQELTGITEVYPELNESEAERTKETTKKEALAEATRQIEQTFTQAMSFRYSKALEDILDAGGKYNDLLQIQPSYFNLPETWSEVLTSNKESSILWAIVEVFRIDEPNTSVRPDLKAIAQEIEAPYSVLMEAHKLPHFLPKIERTIKSKVGDLERRLKKEIRVFIGKQSEEWKSDHLMTVTNKWSQEKVDLQIYQYVSMFIVWFNVILFSEVEPNKELSKMDKEIIKAHKDIIYKEFKPFLDEAKAIYSLPEVEKEILKMSKAK